MSFEELVAKTLANDRTFIVNIKGTYLESDVEFFNEVELLHNSLDKEDFRHENE